MDTLNQLSIKNLSFKKTKDKIGEYRKNYIPLNIKGEKIKIKLENVTIPFGMEKYNSSNIINIEISPKKNNDHHNYHAIISSFEKEFTDLDLIKNKELKKELIDKQYYNNMRDSKDGFIIRTHLFNMPEIYLNMGKFKNLLTLSDITKTKANVELELAMVWLNEHNYGIIWRIKEIEVLYSF
jgi:hypothetical protein